MKSKILFPILLGVGLCTAQAQEKSLDVLNSELDQQKAAKAAAEAKIKETEALIEKQTPKKDWTKAGYVALNFGQTALVNWAAGGNSNFTAVLIANYKANLKKGKHNWNNTFDAKWGLIKNFDFNNGTSEPIRKNEDFLQIQTDYAYDLTATGKFQAGFMADFQSQFTATYSSKAGEDSVLISKFMAPAYLKLGPFIGYKFTDYFKFRFSPAAGKITFVNDPILAASKLYTPDGSKLRAELGAYMTFLFEKELVKNIKLRSQLDLFDNYLNDEVDDNGKSKRWNIDVNWKVDLFMKLNKYMNVSISTNLIYDEDQRITQKDGSKRPRTQFRENLGIGLSYTF